MVFASIMLKPLVLIRLNVSCHSRPFAHALIAAQLMVFTSIMLKIIMKISTC